MPEFSGHLSLRAAARDDGRTVLAAQAFRAPYHVSKPYWDADARALLVQVVNPTAGILAGDRLESEIAVGRDAALLVTTPSASRVFQMRDGVAECRQDFSVTAGGWLEVMPEPLVPHRDSRYHQFTNIDVESGGALFFVDQLMCGRVAHGEAWQWKRLRLELGVRLDRELILRERLDQSGEELRALAEFAGSGAAACFANAVLITPETDDHAAWRFEIAALHGRDRVGRGLLTPPFGVAANDTKSAAGSGDPALHDVQVHHDDGAKLWVGVSALRRGGWSIKLVAPDNIRLRQALREVRRILARYFPRLACDPRKL